MNLLAIKSKLEKGKSLGGETVYIKEDNIVCGIGSIYKDQENKSVTIFRSKDETVKVDNFLEILNELYATVGDVEVFIGNEESNRGYVKEIETIEFAQYELIKMLFINI